MLSKYECIYALGVTVVAAVEEEPLASAQFNRAVCGSFVQRRLLWVGEYRNYIKTNLIFHDRDKKVKLTGDVCQFIGEQIRI